MESLEMEGMGVAGERGRTSPRKKKRATVNEKCQTPKCAKVQREKE
jgi:hypothetical protein